jgi:cobalt-zinc-cadmium efflux system membrane fusion protein
VLKPGTRFELIVPTLPGQRFEGRVMATGDFIDPATRTIRVRGLVANPQRLLKSEMLATARITRELPAGVMVPTPAVRLEGAAHWVMVEVAPGTFEQREVGVGYQGQGETLVTSGLSAGDQVVNQNMLMLARQYRLALDAVRPAAAGASAASAARAGASR